MHQPLQFSTNCLLELYRAGTDKFCAGKPASQANDKRRLWILLRKVSAHGIYLPLDKVACHGRFGPTFRNHGADPHRLHPEKSPRIGPVTDLRRARRCVKRIAVQSKMHTFRNDDSRQNSLELRSGFEPLH